MVPVRPGVPWRPAFFAARVTKPAGRGNQRFMFDLTIAGAAARLILRRAEARNAIPLAGWTALAEAARRAAREGAHLLLVSGEPGGAFCAGADMADFPAFIDDAAARARFREALRHGIDTLAELPIPTVALVEGACFGAGVALAMACDLRVAGPGARFAITPAKFGISYPQEDVRRLVSLVGPGQAARLLFGAGAIDAGEAARIGLVEIAADDAEAAAGALAEAIAANGADSLRVLKRGIRLAAAGVASDAEQDRSFDALLGSDVLAERLAAHRRRPR